MSAYERCPPTGGVCQQRFDCKQSLLRSTFWEILNVGSCDSAIHTGLVCENV